MDAANCDSLYLEIQSEIESIVNCPIQSAIAIFLASLCDCNSVLITLVGKDTSEKHKSVSIDALKRYNIQRSTYESIPDVVKQCALPAILSFDGTLIRCGLCGVLRHVLHLVERKQPDQHRKKLLVRVIYFSSGFCSPIWYRLSPQRISPKVFNLLKNC